MDPTVADRPAHSLEALLEREEIIDVLTTLFVATDRRDWEAVRACFAPQVHFDMTSLAGGAPVMQSPEEIAGAWEEGLRPIRAVHHQVGNFRVRLEGVPGEEAVASCYGIAYHYLPKASGRNTRVFVGSYDFRLRHIGGFWRIGAFKFDAKFVDGNLELEAAD